MRRRTLLKTTSGGGINPSDSSPCDLCFYDRTTDSLIIVAGDAWNRSTYPSSRYVPIGVVVVPGTHNVYGDGSCGVMSLKFLCIPMCVVFGLNFTLYYLFFYLLCKMISVS